MENLHFSEVSDLARLKFFKKNETGELMLKNDIFSKILHINKIIDFHTHLGWNYLLAKPIDLNKESEIKHFFPEKNSPINLSQYSALDFTKEEIKSCQIESVRGIYSNKGYSSTHTIPNILREMARYRIEKSVILAIDYPVYSRNSDQILNALKGNEKLVPFASIHPSQKNKEDLLHHFVEEGAKGIKIHPQIQLANPIHNGYYEIYELCSKYNLPILLHTGSSPLTPSFLTRYTKAKYYKQIVQDFPNNTFIFGHGGGTDTYLQLAEIARYNENVYLEIGGQSIETLLLTIDMMGSDRILYGTDWPYFPMGMQLAKVLLATEKKPIIQRKILYWNAKRLMKKFNM